MEKKKKEDGAQTENQTAQATMSYGRVSLPF